MGAGLVNILSNNITKKPNKEITFSKQQKKKEEI